MGSCPDTDINPIFVWACEDGVKITKEMVEHPRVYFSENSL